MVPRYGGAVVLQPRPVVVPGKQCPPDHAVLDFRPPVEYDARAERPEMDFFQIIWDDGNAPNGNGKESD